METAARPATRRKAPPRFEQFYAIRRFQPTLAFTPDGRKLYFSADISGQFNLWRVSVRGGWPEQLTTFAEQSVRAVDIAPDGRIVFNADPHGDEFHQIYALPARGGWPEQWTDAPQVQHFFGLLSGWSPDGRRFAYAANAETPTNQEVWVRDVETGEVEKVFGGERMAWAGAWSPDGSRLTCFDFRSNTDSSIYLVEDGEARELTPHEGEVNFIPGPWAQDGSGFYLRTDEGREFGGLAFYRLDQGRYEWVETPEADVEELAPRPTGASWGGRSTRTAGPASASATSIRASSCPSRSCRRASAAGGDRPC